MKVRHSVPLANYTSLRVGGPAETLVELEPSDSLSAALKDQPQPIWVIGRGTNCLVSDKGLPGTVVINQTNGITQLSPTRLRAESGVVWDDFIQKAISLGLYGLEFTSGIPGSVGAAVAGNIAAYGHSIGSRFVEATILDSRDGSVNVWNNQAFDFSYRNSNLQRPENKSLVVVDATFEFSPTPTGELEYDSALAVANELGLKADSLANRRTIILEARRRAGSLLIHTEDGPWTAGSFFKNPTVSQEQVQTILGFEEAGISREHLLHQNQVHSGNSVRVSAAHVLLAAGFKRGQTWGQVRLHPHHVLKVENIGQATAQEIYDVVHLIIKTVHEKLGIKLEPEVRFLGDFN